MLFVLFAYDKKALVNNFIIAYEKAITKTPIMALVMADFPFDIFDALNTLLAYRYPA
jgi:hypothetical protein